MTLEAFKQSLSGAAPPEHLPVHLLALWHDAKDNWHRAHELIQDLPDQRASQIHAYLHRKEGDLWNADYWYAKAATKRPSGTLSEEWTALAETMLSTAD